MADSVERRKRIDFRKLGSISPKPLTPEMTELIKINELGAIGNAIDGVLPIAVQRVLISMFPGNQTFKRLKSLNDYRQHHNIQISRLPL